MATNPIPRGHEILLRKKLIRNGEAHVQKFDSLFVTMGPKGGKVTVDSVCENADMHMFVKVPEDYQEPFTLHVDKVGTLIIIGVIAPRLSVLAKAVEKLTVTKSYFDVLRHSECSTQEGNVSLTFSTIREISYLSDSEFVEARMNGLSCRSITLSIQDGCIGARNIHGSDGQAGTISIETNSATVNFRDIGKMWTYVDSGNGNVHLYRASKESAYFIKTSAANLSGFSDPDAVVMFQSTTGSNNLKPYSKEDDKLEKNDVSDDEEEEEDDDEEGETDKRGNLKGFVANSDEEEEEDSEEERIPKKDENPSKKRKISLK